MSIPGCLPRRRTAFPRVAGGRGRSWAVSLAVAIAAHGLPGPRLAGAAQDGLVVPVLSDSAKATLLTILPGDDLYSLFGHSALRITDPVLGIDEAYNFGTFDFGDSPTAMADFIARFTYGDLTYRLTVQAPERMVAWYWREQGRATVEQTLNLTPEVRQELFRLLRVNARPENVYYQYDFFFDNCATRLLDVLETAAGAALSFDEAVEPGESFRGLLDRYLTAAPWTDFGMDLGLGLPADRIASAREAAFLPEYLMEYFAAGRLEVGEGSAPLVGETRWLTGGQEAEWTSKPTPRWPRLLLYALLAAGLLLTVFDLRAGRAWRPVIDGAFFGALGVAGLAIAFLWFVSLHGVTKTNLNFFWAWPTHLALIGLGRRNSRRVGLYLAAAAAAAVILLAGFPAWPQALPAAVAPLLGLIAVRAGGLAWLRLRRPA